MARNNKKTQRFQSEYKGPFQSNKNLDFDNVKKSMKTPTDGPTADMRSYNDSTISQSQKDNQAFSRKRPKAFSKRAEGWLSENWKGCVIGLVSTAIATGIGIVVYTHSNQIVSINKDIEYMKEFDNECKNDFDKLEDVVMENKTNIKLNQQRIDDIRERKQNVKK